MHLQLKRLHKIENVVQTMKSGGGGRAWYLSTKAIDKGYRQRLSTKAIDKGLVPIDFSATHLNVFKTARAPASLLAWKTHHTINGVSTYMLCIRGVFWLGPPAPKVLGSDSKGTGVW